MSELTTVVFKGCEHLNFKKEYAALRQQTPLGLFWMRRDPENNLQMVQYCKLKGRLYGCESCLGEKNKQCNSYNEIEHSITLPQFELDEDA